MGCRGSKVQILSPRPSKRVRSKSFGGPSTARRGTLVPPSRPIAVSPTLPPGAKTGLSACGRAPRVPGHASCIDQPLPPLRHGEHHECRASPPDGSHLGAGARPRAAQHRPHHRRPLQQPAAAGRDRPPDRRQAQPRALRHAEPRARVRAQQPRRHGPHRLQAARVRRHRAREADPRARRIASTCRSS